MPWPKSAVLTACSRSITRRMAWRTRTSLNGAVSTRIVIGFHAAVGETTVCRLPLACSTGTWANGTWLIASTWPESSALTRAESSGSSTITSRSSFGLRPQ